MPMSFWAPPGGPLFPDNFKSPRHFLWGSTRLFAFHRVSKLHTTGLQVIHSCECKHRHRRNGSWLLLAWKVASLSKLVLAGQGGGCIGGLGHPDGQQLNAPAKHALAVLCILQKRAWKAQRCCHQ